MVPALEGPWKWVGHPAAPSVTEVVVLLRALTVALMFALPAGCVSFKVTRDERVEETTLGERESGFLVDVAPSRGAPTLMALSFSRQVTRSFRETKTYIREFEFAYDVTFTKVLDDERIVLLPFAMAYDLACFAITAPVVYPIGLIEWLLLEDAPPPETTEKEEAQRRPIPTGARIVFAESRGGSHVEEWTATTQAIEIDVAPAARVVLASGDPRFEVQMWELERPEHSATWRVFSDVAGPIQALRTALASQSPQAQLQAWLGLYERCPLEAAQTVDALEAEVRRCNGGKPLLRAERLAEERARVSEKLQRLEGEVQELQADESSWVRCADLLAQGAKLMLEHRELDRDPATRRELGVAAAQAFRSAARFARATGDSARSDMYLRAAVGAEH